jgi:hypothetical protein
MRYLVLRAPILLVCAALAGCGETHGNVTGTVTFDGQAIPNGSITFVKSDGTAREGAVIKDGNFQTRLAPGRYKVEVNAQKVVSKRKQKGMSGEIEEVEVTEEMIPERYNSKTELSEEIKSGSHTIKLDLKSKP